MLPSAGRSVCSTTVFASGIIKRSRTVLRYCSAVRRRSGEMPTRTVPGVTGVGSAPLPPAPPMFVPPPLVLPLVLPVPPPLFGGLVMSSGPVVPPPPLLPTTEPVQASAHTPAARAARRTRGAPPAPGRSPTGTVRPRAMLNMFRLRPTLFAFFDKTCKHSRAATFRLGLLKSCFPRPILVLLLRFWRWTAPSGGTSGRSYGPNRPRSRARRQRRCGIYCPGAAPVEGG